MVKPVHTPLSYRIRAELFTQLARMEIAGLPFDKAVSRSKKRSKKGPALFFFKTIHADPFDSLCGNSGGDEAANNANLPVDFFSAPFAETVVDQLRDG